MLVSVHLILFQCAEIIIETNGATLVPSQSAPRFNASKTESIKLVVEPKFCMLCAGQTADTMREDAPPDGVAEARETARTHLFMAATLHGADAAHPVRIRDLSAAGAQIESTLLPEVGSEITLARGCLSVQGRVTWCTARRFGLQFTSPISVPDWMANPLHLQQQRVDQVVALVKAGVVPVEMSAQRNAATPGLIAEDLRRVSRLLEILGDALASDPTIVVKHGIQLQNLDIALQFLAALAETTESDGAECQASLDRLAELRASCAEALQGKLS